MGSPRRPGFRFHPYDEEIVKYYLEPKLLGNDSNLHDVITEVDIYKFEPWDLPAFSKVNKPDDHEWFFFGPLDLKYTKDSRSKRNRKTEAGFWKPTGKDRSIRIRGTNTVIGTKKTLVFHKGRNSKGVKILKTNWVIHEYHAVASPADKQRAFVLYRLIEKEEINVERGTDTLIHDKGEPSSHIAVDFENKVTTDISPDENAFPYNNQESIFPTPFQAEEYVTEQEPSFQGSTGPDAYFGKEQFLFETTEEEENFDIDMFVNGILADEDAFNGNETIPALAGDFTPSESLKVYHESSKTSAKPLSAQHGNINAAASSSVCYKLSTEKEVMSTVKSSHDAVYTPPCPLSSRNEVNLEKNDGTFDDYFFELETVGDLTSTPLPILLIQSVGTPSPSSARSPSPSRGCKKKCHPISMNFVPHLGERSEEHKKVSSQAITPREAQKETCIPKSNKVRKPALGTSARKNLKTTSNQSPAFNGKGSSTYLDTPLSVKLLQHDNSRDTTSSEFTTLDDDEFRGLLAYDYNIAFKFTRITPSPSPPSTRSPSPQGRYQNEYRPRSRNFVSLRAAAGKSQTQRNSLSQAISLQEALKEALKLESNKVHSKSQGTSSIKKLGTICNASRGKGSSIHLKTSLVQRSWNLLMWSCAWHGLISP